MRSYDKVEERERERERESVGDVEKRVIQREGESK